jgi:hypothetical protein
MQFADVALTVILSGVALVAILLRGFRWVMDQWAVKHGLIRPDSEHQWPNDWHTLPDTLDGIYKEMQAHHAKDGH